MRAESPAATLGYTYNAAGLRYAQSVDGDETTFAWDWDSSVPELLRQGPTRYLVGHDTLGWHNGKGWTYHLPDALGSVRQGTDAAGAVVRAREWTPFGVAVGESTVGCCPSTSSPIPTPPIRCVEKANDTFYPQPERRFKPQVKLPVIYDQYTDSVFESDIPMPDTAAEPIKRAACGATCMAMVLQYYGTDEKPYDVIALAEINGYWDSQGGGIRARDMATLFVEQYDEKNIRHPGGYGFSHVEYYNHLTMEIVASSMTNEIPLMIGVNGVGGNGNGLKGGTYHAVLIVGLSEDTETVMVVDPSGCEAAQAYDSCLIVAAGYAIEAAK